MSKNDWRNIAATQPIERLMHTILTACDKPENFVANPELICRLGSTYERLSILDIGCGLGRNLIGIATHSPLWNATGYDLPEMIARASAYLKEKVVHRAIAARIFITSDFEKAFSQPCDVALACYCFQHIDAGELEMILSAVKRTTKRLVVCGRRVMDDGTPDCFKLIAACGWKQKSGDYYPAGGSEDHFTVDYEPA